MLDLRGSAARDGWANGEEAPEVMENHICEELGCELVEVALSS